MNIEDIRKQSIEQFAALRRKALFEAQQNSPITITTSAAAGGSSGGGSSNVLTPFIVQAWGLGEAQEWGLYQLTSKGDKIPVLNAPPLEGPTVFSKNTLNGLHYYVTFDGTTTNFGLWDSLTGEWQFLEEGTSTLLRNLVPASLQYVEGVEGTGNYFIYTDNSQYIGSEDEIAPITFRIDLDTPTSFELTELHEWEPPIEVFGSFPVSTFYQLPVDTEAIPPQDLFQVQAFANFSGGIPLTILSSVNGDTYEKTEIGFMEINGLPIEAVKIAFILDRTDYEGDTYFNVFALDKINESPLLYIAKFDPENPSNLTSIYQYNWDSNFYVNLTTI